MRRLHMIDAEAGQRGITFKASEDAAAFVEALRSEYSRELKERAVWLASFLTKISDADLAALISARIGRWAVEFQGDAGAPSAS